MNPSYVAALTYKRLNFSPTDMLLIFSLRSSVMTASAVVVTGTCQNLADPPPSRVLELILCANLYRQPDCCYWRCVSIDSMMCRKLSVESLCSVFCHVRMSERCVSGVLIVTLCKFRRPSVFLAD